MASDWIIIGAVIVLVAGVVLVFRTAAVDAPKNEKQARNSTTKRAISNG